MRKKQVGWLTVLCLVVALVLGPGAPPAQSFGPVLDKSRIFIEAPLAGETLTGGSKYEIMWDVAINDYVQFDLAYTTDGGATYEIIVTGDKNTFTIDDSYTWTVPNIAAPSIQIAVILTVPSNSMPQIPTAYYNLSGQFSIKKSSNLLKPNLPDINPVILIPLAPANLTGTALSTNSVKLEWEDKSSNETNFIIERKGPGMAPNEEIATVNANVTTFTDTGLTADTEYMYQVRASNQNGKSNFAGPVTVQTKAAIVLPVITLAAPTELKADSVTNTNVVLSWKDNSDNESGFKIERATGSGTYTELAAVAAGIVSYTDPSVIQGNAYSYRVRAWNSNENSAYSNTVTVNIAAGTTPPAETETKPPTGSPETTLRFVIGQSKYSWNGTNQPMDVAPIIREGRTLLPVRYVADPLGAQVLWNEAERKVTIKTTSKTIELWINNNTATVNGTKVLIDPNNTKVMPVVIPPGRTMLPLRFIADNLDCNVEWNYANKEAIVTYPK